MICTINALSTELDKLTEILPAILNYSTAEFVVDPDTSPLVKQYDQLLKWRSSEIKSLNTLATAMRLTQHSRYDPKSAARDSDKSGGESKPWQQQR